MREIINFGQMGLEESEALVKNISDPARYYLICERLRIAPTNSNLYEQGKRTVQVRGAPDILITPPYRQPIIETSVEKRRKEELEALNDPRGDIGYPPKKKRR